MTGNSFVKRAAVLVLGFGLAASGCVRAPSETTQPQNSSVSSSYAELVNAFASCAQQVSACVQSANGDSAALQTCRDDFASCRDSAGQHAVNAMADAVRACTDANRQCEASNHGSTGSKDCQQTLLACLQANHPDHPDTAKNDDDAGTDQSAGRAHAAAVADCLDTLHSCVSAGGQPQTCAQAVRACVLASVPAPADVIPGAGSANAAHGNAGQSGADHGSAGHGGGTPDEHSADAGRPSDVPKGPPTGGAGAGMSHAADAGAASNAAMQCLDAFQACVAAGGQARTCAQALQQCNRSARP